ncbi:MAG TPA: serine hydrolase domain-containing protein [Stenomitos sp.]
MTKLQPTVQLLLDDLVASGAEVGLQVAAYYQGELVVDAWAGMADATRPVTADTLFTAFSATKGVTATVIHALAEDGLLDYDTAVAHYWPAFAANGKERITLRHVLTHTAGVPQMPSGTTPERMIDWPWMVEAIAQLSPLWEPGTRTGYHGLTYGWILGEVAQRASGQSFQELVQARIKGPLGITDLYLGIPASEEGRMAPLQSGPISRKPISPEALLLKAIPIAVSPSPKVYNRPEVREAVLPGGGGIMTARALAKMYASLVSTVDGCRLLSPERVATATTRQVEAHDEVLDEPIPKGLGYFLGSPHSPMGTSPTLFGHPGAGGSLGFADARHGFAFALTKNRLVWDRPAHETAAYQVSQLIRQGLGIGD